MIETPESTARELANIRHALDKSAIVAITDRAGTIIHVNDKFCEISKYAREELIGKNHRVVNSGYHSKEYFVGQLSSCSVRLDAKVCCTARSKLLADRSLSPS